MMRPSDRFRYSVSLLDPEFCEWAMAILDLWGTDPQLHLEYETVIDFFDAAFAFSERLIRSAVKGDISG